MTSKRLFAAIVLPDSIKEALSRLDPQIDGVRWSSAMHLTIGFFGDVSPETESALRERLGTIQFAAFFLPVSGKSSSPEPVQVRATRR